MSEKPDFPEEPPQVTRRVHFSLLNVAGILIIVAVLLFTMFGSRVARADAMAIEIVRNVAVIYLWILIGLRFLGKREFAQLSVAELVTLLLIPDIASQAFSNEPYGLLKAIAGIATIFLLVFVSSTLMHRFRAIEALLTDKASLLVTRGKLCQEVMDKERISPDELYAAMHESGLDHLANVKWAILESDGEITVIPEDNLVYSFKQHAKGTMA